MIIYNNNYVGAFKKTENKLMQHYINQNKQNKRNSNPTAYIVDKYINSNSSYYRSDMTKEQRDIAMKNEADMLRYGKLTAIYYDDYTLKDNVEVDSNVESAKERQYNIDAVNNQIAELFKENNITLSTEITFSINPYNYQLSIDGLKDEGLKKQIEDKLNKDRNSENLFYHVLTRYTDKQSIEKNTYNKFQAYREVKNHTGYDLRKLENKDGKFITPEGMDIREIYSNSIQKAPYMSQAQKTDVSMYYGNIISEIAQTGWDNIADLNLTIKYSEGKLKAISS